MTSQNKILLSRFLTRFGDQAWDFAVPLVLIQLFPGQIQLISFLYLFSKFVQIFKGPSFQKKIDHNDRISIYKIGIGYQTIAMILMWFLISSLFMIKGVALMDLGLQKVRKTVTSQFQMSLNGFLKSLGLNQI